MKSKNKHLSVSDDNCSCSTELTLGLVFRESTRQFCGTKRRLDEAIELSLGSSTSRNPHHKSREDDNSTNEISRGTKPSPHETQVVGWPPVISLRKKEVQKWRKYVKVAVDGAPYLRKVELEMYTSYDQLLNVLPDLFTCLTICNFINERKLMDPTINGVEYLPTYEDKDGDRMLLGDVPWKIFVESCRRLRLMKSSEATGSAPRTSLLLLKCSSTAS